MNDLNFLKKYYNQYVYYDIEEYFKMQNTQEVSYFRSKFGANNNNERKGMDFILFINCIKYQRNYFAE